MQQLAVSESSTQQVLVHSGTSEILLYISGVMFLTIGKVLGLKNLQILDMSYNHVSVIPEEIRKMFSLMFLAMEGNKIKRLPVCLGEMSRLTKVKFGGNPIEFPPRRILTAHGNGHPPSGEKSRQICSQLKLYLKEYAASTAKDVGRRAAGLYDPR